jgi:lactate dehydrogenase-like 2-hydroxyacid dehydrogenase
MKANGNKLVLCFGAGFDNVPLETLKREITL